MIPETTYMQRALDLAVLGLGSVSPNPMVGAVIVHAGRIIGEGWHRKFGGPHAEVEAVRSVEDSSLLPESTMYVTLEPCSHFGKTPPCAELLIEQKIKKVVIAMGDPNPLVAGKGIEKLKQAGIETVFPVLEEEARTVNKRFLTNIGKKRPYVILKWAQSANGYMAPSLTSSREEKQISNALSQQLVHAWRAQEDAIMVGYNTLMYDNPRLNVRLTDTHRQPTRITWDERDAAAGNYHFFDGSQHSFVFNHLKDENLETHRLFQISREEDAVEHLLSRLLNEGIGSVLVEGGAKLLQKFLRANVWDEARICTSPRQIMNGIPSPVIPHRPQQTFSLKEDDWKIIFNSQA